MTSRATRRRRRWDVSGLILPVLLLVVAFGGLALMARSMGWLGGGPSGPRSAPPGTVAVPAAAISIPTYTRVRLDHLVDRRTGDLRAVYLPEGSLLPETFVDAKQIIGRVLATDKAPGQLFSTQDFFPPGTREGIVAGIPPGKRALRLDASKVNGIVGLGHGDRFDLVATFDLRRTGAGGVQVQGAGVNELGALGSQIRTARVVADGAVVQPLMARALPGQTRQIVEEMVIAVDPAEVGGLTEALHAGARIDCVPRSGQPATASDAEANSAGQSRNGLRVIETISGGKRSVIAVPPSADEESLSDALPMVGAGSGGS